jgi:hypothetical protein
MKILLACIAIASIALGCVTTTEPSTEAQKLTMIDLTQTPGFTWFVAEIDRYAPDTTHVNRVKASMAASPEKKVYIFVRPSCSCRGTQRMFPQVMKTLMNAGVESSRIEVWSMKNTTDSQPYASLFSVSQLPAFFVVENNTVKSSMGDDFATNYNEENADSLIANAVSR